MNEIFWRKILNELHYLRDRKENQPFVDIINGKNRSTRPNYRILPFTCQFNPFLRVGLHGGKTSAFE